jgi:hypothetical protein
LELARERFMAAPNERRHGSILRRLRPRFRLRTLLVLTTLVCVWLGISMERKYREERAIRIIAAAGGGYGGQFSWFYPFRSVNVVSFSGQKFTDARLADVADALAELPSLEYLQIVQTSVTDAGLAAIRGIDGVHQLDLWGTPITDAGIEHLVEMHNLRHLDVSATLISDKGVARLADLHHLETLELPTDAIAAAPRYSIPLNRILFFRSYSLPGVVSQSAVKDLQKRLPGCSIRQTKSYSPPRKGSITPNPIPYELR